MPSSSSAKLQFDNWQFFKESTGIKTINSKSKGDGVVYDLQGRKVANSENLSAKGLYIVNGKKVIK